MGTDIHMVIQCRPIGISSDDTNLKETTPFPWKDISEEECEALYEGYDCRSYRRFAVLAGVRNGFGFAGSFNHKPIEPIAQPRGFPEDFEVADNDPSEHCGEWMGDHTYSWLNADEILEWYKTPHLTTAAGYVPAEFFKTWDGVTPPDCYVGGISGPNIVCVNWDGKTLPSKQIESNPGQSLVDPSAVPFTHIRIFWSEDMRDAFEDFIPMLIELKRRHGEIRLVFGFDS